MREENSRIAKNTFFLYIRQFVVLAISLYTSRVVLDVLGVTDFGLYNVVGGVIVIFGFVTNALSNSTSRFLAFAIGKKEYAEIERTFGSFLTLYYCLALLIFVLGETIGLWFVYNYMTIPPERFTAALWVYHFSVVTAVMNVLYIPHDSLIVAREKMSAFAYISIMDAVIKLIIVFLISISSFDKLIFYAALIFLSKCIDRIIYVYYCKKNFSESSAPLSYNKSLLSEILRYSCWILFGSLSFATYTQGINILLNVFFGPAVNAARGVAVQVQSASQNFIVGFQTALYPQIIKSYAQKDFPRMYTLLHTACKGSFFLFFILAVPIIMKAPFILGIWLKDVPDYAVPFTSLILLFSMLRAITNEINHAVQATGKIKKFQVIEGLLGLLILPFAYLSLAFLHTDPISVFIIMVAMEFISVFVRISIGIPQIGDSRRDFFKCVMFPIVYVTILGGIVPWIFARITDQNLCGFLVISVIDVIWVVPVIFFLGLTKKEKGLVVDKLKLLRRKFA